jgi:beta-lactamase regulating signal transducer with metallopeptidase domain/Tol biopolymer transport system component
MEGIMAFIQLFFDWLLQTTLIGSVVICLILVIQKMLGGRLGPRWCHALWLVLLMRMILPWAPSSRLSLVNLIPSMDRQNKIQRLSETTRQQEVSQTLQTFDSTDAIKVDESESVAEIKQKAIAKPDTVVEIQKGSQLKLISLRRALPILWLVGAIVVGAYIFVSNFALWRIVKCDRPLVDQEMLELFEECKTQMNVQSLVAVVPSDQVRSPGLFGFVRPRLLLPREMLDNATREEMRYVFLHELAHLKRSDIYLGWLTSLLQILHWFNPVVWFAFYRMRMDRELACDALVLTRTGQEKSHDYGGAIVGLLRRFSRSRRLPALAGIVENRSQLKRRIAMITEFKKNSYQWSPLAIVLIIILACVSLPDAKLMRASETNSMVPVSSITVRRLEYKWRGPFASLSPDGRYISDRDWDTGTLVIHELATGKSRTLIGRESHEAGSPLVSVISPNSKEIAYLWHNRKTNASSLHVVGLDGAGHRVLCKGKWPMPREWSADGKKILVILLENDVWQMVWISTSDGSIQSIASVGKSHPGKIDVSQDGRFIAYDHPQDEDISNQDIFVFDQSDNREVCVVKHPANDKLLGWTPDGRYILFSSDRTGTWDAWLLRVADGKPQGFPKLARHGIGNITPIGFTPQGSYYYGHEQTLRDVFIAKLDLETGQFLSVPVPVRQSGATAVHDWSPDGRYLAYCERRRDESWAIHIRALETGREWILAENIPYIHWLRWSLDMGSILIDGYKRGDSHGVIFRIDLQTGERTDLVRSKTEVLVRPEISPDGKTLFYYRSKDPKSKTVRLIARDLETGRERELFQVVSPAQLTNFALSPDGQRFVLSIVPDPTRRPVGPILKILSVAGGQPRDLIQFDKSERLRAVGVTWTPDSRDVLFWKWWYQADKEIELWRISAEGGEPRKLCSRKVFGHLRVHPDGKRVAFHDRSTTRGLWLMENFLPESVAGK